VGHGRVVTAVEVDPDLAVAPGGQAAGQVHGDVSGENHGTALGGTADLRDAQGEAPRRGGRDAAQRRRSIPQALCNGLLDRGGGDRLLLHLGQEIQMQQRAPKLGQASLESIRQRLGGIHRQGEAARLGEAPRGCQTRGTARQDQRYSQPRCQAASQARQQGGQSLGGIGSQQHPANPLQGIQGVQQFLLGGRPAGKMLQVIDGQQIHAAVPILKFLRGLGLEGVGQFPGEVDGRHVHGRPRPAPLPPDRCQAPGQMRLAAARGPHQSDGVVVRVVAFQQGVDDHADKGILGSDQEAPQEGHVGCNAITTRWGYQSGARYGYLDHRVSHRPRASEDRKPSAHRRRPQADYCSRFWRRLRGEDRGWAIIVAG